MESLIAGALGIVFVVIGILNRMGNISMLHARHRKRVSDEDRLPFGKLVGLGTLIIGIALIVASVFMFLFTTYGNKVFMILGNVFLIGGFVVGLAISFYAMKKYNKGIF